MDPNNGVTIDSDLSVTGEVKGNLNTINVNVDGNLTVVGTTTLDTVSTDKIEAKTQGKSIQIAYPVRDLEVVFKRKDMPANFNLTGSGRFNLHLM